jgi:hypothetical protein
MLSGGAAYNHLDSSFMIDDETGSGKAEWFGKTRDYRELRRQLGHLKRFLESVDFVRLSRRHDLFRSVPENAKVYGIADHGRTYLIYVEGKGSGKLSLNTPNGRYRAEWVKPTTGEPVHEVDLVAREGILTLDIPAVAEDMALRVRAATRIDDTNSR